MPLAKLKRFQKKIELLTSHIQEGNMAHFPHLGKQQWRSIRFLFPEFLINKYIFDSIC